jgi:subtilisin family serine protease
MSHLGRRWAQCLNIPRWIGGQNRARRGTVTAWRPAPSVQLVMSVDELEYRTMLSVGTTLGATSPPVRTVGLLTVPNDPDYVNGNQWQLNGTWGVNAPAAWSVTTGSDGVIVADVDSGLNYNLPDLYDNVWLNQPEIPASVVGNLADTNNDGVITFTDLNSPVNQGPGKIEDTNGDGVITGADVLAATSAGGWVNPNAPNTQDGDTAAPNDFIGWNFAANTNNPMDDLGHGTFTASVIGEVTNNAVGGAGLVWNAQIMPLKFLDSSGDGTDYAAAEAIEYAVRHGAKVINASWGSTGADPTIEAAIQYANKYGVIIVAAAGNSGTDDDTSFFSPAAYSAQYPNVISVAAIGSDGTLASFSNYGVNTVQIAAPGVNVYGTLSNGTYGAMSGSSMAAPLVTGTVALVEAAHPSWTMSQVIDAVLDTVTPDPALAGKVSTGGVVNAGAAVANTDGPYVVSATPGGSSYTAGASFTLELTFNEEINPATFTAAQVALSGPGGSVPANGVSVSPIAGSNNHEFQISFAAPTVAGSYTLNVGPGIEDWYGNQMNQNRNGVNGEASDAFVETGITVQAAALAKLAVTGFPANATAGTPYNVTVTTTDTYGNVITGYIGTVSVSSTDPNAVLPGAYTFVAADQGTHTFTAVLDTAGAQAITATDTASGISGGETGIAVQAAALARLAVTGFPTSIVAGTPSAITVSTEDSYNNIITCYRGAVSLDSSDLNATLPAVYTFTASDAGTHTFAVSLDTAGTQSITAQDVQDSAIVDSESGIVVRAAPATRLVLSGYPSLTTAGATQSFMLTAEDLFGNTATTYNGTIRFSTTDGQDSPGAGLPLDYTFTTGAGGDNGAHTFTALLKTAGTQSITARDTQSPGIKGTQSGIAVGPASASRLAFIQQPAGGVAGATISPTVMVAIEDAYHNVVTTDNSTVSLVLSGGTFEGGSSMVPAAASSGVATFTGLKIDAAGRYAVSATDGQLASSGASGSFAINSAAPARVVIHTEPSQAATAGQPFATQPVIYEEDRFGNLETGDNSSIISASLAAGAVSLEGRTAVTVSGGIAEFTSLADNQAQTITINFDGGALDPATSIPVSVHAGAATRLSVTTPPPDRLTAGQPFGLIVSAEDPYGNVDTNYNGSVTISIPNAPGFTASVQAKNGVAVFSGLIVNATTNGKTIRADASGLTGGMTDPLNVAAAVQPPTIVGEQVLKMQKKNRNGKSAGKPKFTGFTLRFSTQMNPVSAGLGASYQIDSATKKHIKKRTEKAVAPVMFTSTFDASSNTVTLTVRGGGGKFESGGQLTVNASPPNGVASADGVFLNAADTSFLILPKAKGIVAAR